jgi:hypothetical protein
MEQIGPEQQPPDARIMVGSRMIEHITRSVSPSIETSAGPPLAKRTLQN